MLVDLILLASAAALGLYLQRRPGGGTTIRERLWLANYAVLIPLAAVYAFLAIDLDAHLLRIVGCAVVAWWLTVGASYLWARAVARSRPRRAALTFVGAFPNTGFIGFPLANLAFGSDGLRLAVVYDQVSLLVPAIVVATMIARRHATRVPTGADAERPLAWQVLASPPTWTVAMLVVLRLTVVREPIELETLGTVVSAVVGPVGFLLLGLSVPLHGFGHARREVAEVAGAVAVRVGVAPAFVWVVAHVTRTDVPTALYLVAAMPVAFHALVIARAHDLDVAVVRLGVLVSTVLVVGATVASTALNAA